MKKTLIIVFLLLTVMIFADGWKKTGDFNLLLSQTYYSDNWDGGEMGNINWTASFNMIMEKQLSSMLYDKNTLKIAFGQTHYQERDDMGELFWKRPEITTDLIDYENMLTFTLQKFVDPYLALRYESKYYDGSNADETFYFNPSTITLSLGARKVMIDQEIQNMEARLGAAYKSLLNQDELIDNMSNAGVEFVLSYWYVFPSELGKYDSMLRIYEALIYSEEDDALNDDWKSPDVEFTNTLTFKLSSYVGLKFYLEMLYDKEIVHEVRFKENLGVNLSYSLF